jgi:hypothetical protein
MKKRRLALLAAFLGGIIISGCGDDQPNAAKPEQVNQDFAKSAAEAMRNANTGMDPKKTTMPEAEKKK